MIKKYWDFDLLGVLASKEEVYQMANTYKNVIINKQNYLQFYIKIISETPESFPRNQQLFTCYSTELEKYGFEENFYENENERILQLENFLSESLLIFKPLRKLKSNHEEIFAVSDIRLIPKLEIYDNSQKFKQIPVFSSVSTKLTRDEFYEFLVQGKYLGDVSGISTEIIDTPSIIVWKENSDFEAFGLFSSHGDYTHKGGLSLISDIGVRYVKLGNLNYNYYCEDSKEDSFIFIDLVAYTKIEEDLEGITPLPYEKKIEKIKLPERILENKMINNDQFDKDLMNEEDVPFKENEFLEHFTTVTHDMGLYYSEKDLLNFHTSVKSNTLTILAGMSGTGKSKIVQAYGKALGLDHTQLVFIPVRPSWTDDTDLLGYVDTKNMLYRPSDTYLIDTLFAAQNDRNKLYIVCFDEMNLSRVEHYFSQFLSILEMEPNRRVLRLYSDRIEQQIYNSGQYTPSINIGSNILFIGTVNIDESTYHFSDKVLDRANVITLEVQPFDLLLNRESNKDGKDKTKKLFTYDHYNKFRKNEADIKLTNEEISFLWKLHEIMQKESLGFGIGPRIVRQIDSYIKNLPENSSLTRKEAFDIQIVQRILTKLRGPEGLLRDLVESETGLVISLILQYEGISDFTKTKEVLIQKSKELKINGFIL
ncbi:McrB family protein [Paenibacillus xylanexedens]|uniref:McrB family protein n=1 Tax=Paenibacillus xylanexedens TaxID=528191 RepID=UPI003B01FF78